MTLPAFARWLIVITFFLTMASPVQAGGQRESEARAVADRGFALSLAHALETGEHDLALSLLESRPDVSATPDGVRLRAALLARLGRTDEALALLEGWMAGNGSDALARFQVGEIHFAAHRLATARLSYRLALAGSLDATRTQIVHDRLAAIDPIADFRFHGKAARHAKQADSGHQSDRCNEIIHESDSV